MARQLQSEGYDTMPKDSIALKWGSLKRWDVHSDKAMAILDRYMADPVCMSAAMQEHTDAQKQALLELCDAVEEAGGTIFLDWDGVYVNAEQAKKYINDYPNQ